MLTKGKFATSDGQATALMTLHYIIVSAMLAAYITAGLLV